MELTMLPQEENENSRAYAYRLLRSNIMTLRLKPGEVIKEGELCRLLSMSRTPIHEAVTALKEEWLVEVAPQSGTKVTLIDPTLMKEGYSARVLMESALLRDAAGTLTQKQAKQLQECLQAQEAAGNTLARDPDTFMRLDDALHCLMYRFAGRGRTWQALRGLVSHYDRARYLDAMSGKTDLAKVLQEHRTFYNVLLMGLPTETDPTALMAQHLTSFRGDFWDSIGEYRQYFAL